MKSALPDWLVIAVISFMFSAVTAALAVFAYILFVK